MEMINSMMNNLIKVLTYLIFKPKKFAISNAKPKTAKNKFTEKLNIQSEIAKLDAQLKQQENDLKQFNKKFFDILFIFFFFFLEICIHII